MQDSHPFADDLPFPDERTREEDLVFRFRHITKVFWNMRHDLVDRGHRVAECDIDSLAKIRFSEFLNFPKHFQHDELPFTDTIGDMTALC